MLWKADRVFWVILSCLWPAWRHALVIVRPETVIGWHRKGFRLFLDMEVAAGKTGPTAGVEGDPLSGPTEVAGEHTVGRTSDPWRAFEAWLFHLPGRRSRNTWPVTHRRHRSRGGHSLQTTPIAWRRSISSWSPRHVPPPVRVHRAPPRAPPDRALRCHGEPDDGVGRTADPRGIPVGHGAAAPDPRRDGAYGQSFRSTVTAMGVEEVVTAPRKPVAKSVCGTPDRQREARMPGPLDHPQRAAFAAHSWLIPRLLLRFKDPPVDRQGHTGWSTRSAGRAGTVVSLPKVGGLHHRYERLAA